MRRLLLATLALLWAGAAPAESAPEATNEPESRLDADTFRGLALRGIGPALMSGRIADIAIHPDDRSTWYVAVGSGGVWKTENAGTTWDSIFDGQGSYSIGFIAIDPNDPDVIWVGTGEDVGGRHVGYGDGIYRSRDGGQSWTHMGLSESEHLSRILIDPRDSNVIYVAAEGPLWSAGGERGLYKTVDGGETWTKILGGGPYTGANDVVMDPTDPDTLYASTHQRYRTVAALINGGPESGIHKTTDGGKTWRELTRGLPDEDMGKIGLAISHHDPQTIYATIELAWREGGFYRSTDGGESWEKRNDYLSGGTGPHYYQELYASPHDPDTVYQMDVRLHVTEDGGATFRSIDTRNKHVDNHALAFNDDPDYLLVGTDGGLYESWDHGEHWKFIANLPVTQFYKIAVDNAEPFYNVYGGTQDNNTQGGPTRTDTVHGIRNSDWFVTLFGDGHQPAVDPTNPNIVYSQWQQGNLVRHDRATGEIIYLQPQTEADAPAQRWNWDSPILISPHDPARLYFASQWVWRSDDRGDSWTPISDDLSRGRERLQIPMMDDRVWSVDAIWDLWAMSNYGNVTSLSESPLVEGLIYAGTDDGLVHVTEDGGKTWTRIDPTGELTPQEYAEGLEAGGTELTWAPPESFVNDIKADKHDPDTVYVVLDNHKTGDFAPYVYVSRDRGETWSSMIGDLPDRHITWRIVQDHVQPDLFFLGTEFGVFFTVDAGERWIELTGNAPTISYRDLAIQERENDLVGGTFGRGIWILDDYSPLRRVSEETLAEPAQLFDVREVPWYYPRHTLGSNEKASQGAAFFTAPNPPFGALITYYLRDTLDTAKERRSAEEQELKEAGQDIPFPGWERLQAEEREEEPRIVLTIRTADGEIVRRIDGPTGAGLHRVAWDLRYPPTQAVVNVEAEDADERRRWSPMAPPGTYTVDLAKRVEGTLTPLAEPVSFRVTRIGEPTLEGAPMARVTEFAQRLGEVQRQVSGLREIFDDIDTRLRLIKLALRQATVPPNGLDSRVRALQDDYFALRTQMFGNARKDQIGEPMAATIGDRLRAARIGIMRSSYGPTPNLIKTLSIAEAELAEVKQRLNDLVEIELPELEAELEQAGVPWTPGRGVPGL